MPSLTAVVLGAVLSLATARAADPGHPPSRDELIGAWRLVRIEYIGPRGPQSDPYYGTDAVGLLTYEPGGTMSVQIGDRERGDLQVGDDRRRGPPDAASALARAHAFDTYYAYFGRWDYDERHGILTHEVQASLIPAERGRRYTQEVRLEAGRLIFINRSTTAAGVTIRRKIWERVS